VVIDVEAEVACVGDADASGRMVAMVADTLVVSNEISAVDIV